MIDNKELAAGEPIHAVTLVQWKIKEGDWDEREEVIAELEAEKATFELNAEKAGKLKTIAQEGDDLKIGAVIAQIDETATKPAAQEISKPTIEEKKPDLKKESPAIEEATAHATIKITPVANAV